MKATGKSSLEELAGLEVSFDVGHSSIGWAVLEPALTSRDGVVNILGTGVVIFRADDCLASSRRAFRRQRRHIRSTRQRIARMKTLLGALGVLSPEQLNAPGCAWPWQLAARVLRGGKTLSWPQLWDVLRWYAHNRGYDGNRRWSGGEAAEAEQEDTEKEENARTLMGKHGLRSMAETFCAELKVDPLGQKRSSHIRFKGLNAAFPRATVEGEVRRILQAHQGKLPKVDAVLERALLGKDQNDAQAWQAIPCPALKLPKRYQGGLLFGQLVPRFDNRIISKCPITGEKVPGRNCPEFLNFRWAMLLANVRVARFGQKDLTPLSVPERKELDTRMRRVGAMGAEEFKKNVRDVSGAITDNLDTMLMHPDAKEALVLDPVQKLVHSTELKGVWEVLPERLQKRLRGQWRHGKRIRLAAIRTQLADLDADLSGFDAAVESLLAAAGNTRRKGGPRSREQLLATEFCVERLDGRAAYSRPLLKRAYEEVMGGQHPKEEGGCLFMSPEVRQAQLEREIAQQTNNHLVRHRLLILERLMADILREFAGGDKGRVSRITIEVNRDLREMSGLTAKQKAQELGSRIANHRHVAEKLAEDPSLARVLAGRQARITPGLIRKARVAEDLGWRCPYTGQVFEPVDLVTKRVDKDHIVPRADRASDALDSLVVTFSAVNKWKGKRTAYEFIEAEQGKPVPDLPNLSILTLAKYKQLVESLETFKGHEDDKRRKKKRKDLLLLPRYTEKEFTPRDLTMTSQLVRLGASGLQQMFAECSSPPPVVALPGSVTGTVRKAWKVMGCLSLAAPQALDENGDPRPKGEIREITHLHHAVDACVLGLASHFIPNNGRVWELLVKGRWTSGEESELRGLGLFGKDSERRFHLRDLDELDGTLKEQIRARLAERRVVQHIPADLSGMVCKETTWRVFNAEDPHPNARRLARWLAKRQVALPASEARTVLLVCRKRRIAESEGDDEASGKVLRDTKTWRWLYDIRDRTALVGLEPREGGQVSKLKQLKAVKVLAENFGLALDPEPALIRWHKVWHQLKVLRDRNSGKEVRVLRKGVMVRVPVTGKRPQYEGMWVVRGVTLNQKAGFLVDLSPADRIRYRRQPGCLENVSVGTLCKCGLEVVKLPLCGWGPADRSKPARPNVLPHHQR